MMPSNITAVLNNGIIIIVIEIIILSAASIIMYRYNINNVHHFYLYFFKNRIFSPKFVFRKILKK